MKTIPQGQQPSSGFTLIEVLMVVVIVLLATAVAVPSFSRSFEGAALRASTRMVVMASRYARSVAVLQQVQTALLIDATLGSLEVVAIKEQNANRSKFLNDTVSDEEGTARIESSLKKTLNSKVKIIAVSSDNGIEPEKDIYTIIYYPNGMCDPFVATLQDESGKQVAIEVDPISGKSTVNDT